MSVLPVDMLQKFSDRAAGYDRENRFFSEDFEDLRRVGYLKINVPKELGGEGMTLADVCHAQRRLAYFAAPTALAINMHLYWVGVAADLWRKGDKSLEWLLRGAMKGEVYAAGHAESGNDLPVLLSTTKAERVDGGRLETPPLSWKYDWIRRIVGWGPAKRTQMFLQRAKWVVLGACDWVVLWAERTRPARLRLPWS